MNIESVALSALIPYARNARTHNREQVAQLAHSISEFGFNNPVLIAANSEIIAGHGRVLAAHKLGLKEVPCLRLSHLTDVQKRAFILADNRIAQNSGWDETMLAEELKALDAEQFDLSFIGFTSDELSDFGLGVDLEVEKFGARDEAEPAARVLTAKDYGGATSMARTGAPIRYWRERGLLAGDVLDYGCGQEGHDFFKYDIVHHPDPVALLRTYDTVMCNFVLNVQPVEHLITQVIVTLWHCTRPGGRLLISVRNDVDKTGETSRGFQVSKSADEWRDAIADVLGDDLEMVGRSSFTGFIHAKASPT